MVGKTLFAVVLSLFFALAACGTPSMFRVCKIETHANNIEKASQKARLVLERRGYTLEKASTNHIRTEWRYLKIYPRTIAEIWIGWKIEVNLSSEKITVEGWCIRQESKNLARSWLWKKCDDTDMLGIVSGSVEDLAVDLSRF